MTEHVAEHERIPDAVYHRALEARDARFDGVFFVGIRTTKIYCRPICPSRRADPENRRFFPSAASAELAGFRPCLRCRPELAPGRAVVDAVSNIAHAAAQRVAAGALNGRTVDDLASELGVTERHLRRVLKRELGVSPVELAQTHRLLLARQLLAETTLSMSRVAFASGFQSLRRFNAAFRERYRMSPSAIQRLESRSSDSIRLSLPYRPPLAWRELMVLLRRDALPGVEEVSADRYARTVRIDDNVGTVAVWVGSSNRLTAQMSLSLLPALMPLLARLRRLFDLDAEPTVVDAQLDAGGLGHLVRQRRGLRAPGAFDGFEVALSTMLSDAPEDLRGRVTLALGEPVRTETPSLDMLAPTAPRVLEMGAPALMALGVCRDRAESIATLARMVASGDLRLEPGGHAADAFRLLRSISGVDEHMATRIAMRVLHQPDAFSASDRLLQGAAGITDATALRELAERWRPWRAYAAHHFWLSVEEAVEERRTKTNGLIRTALIGSSA